MDEKEKITIYAQDIFISSGFYKVTMDEIAKGLTISKKTIYKYFPSKNILLDTAISFFQKNLTKRILTSLDKQENSILKMKELAKIFAEVSLKLSPQLLYDIKTHRPDLWEQIEKFREKMIKSAWIDIINQGKKEKYIIDKPNELIITVIYSAIQGVINPEFLLSQKFSIQEAFKMTFGIIIKGVLTNKGLEVYKKTEHENEN